MTVLQAISRGFSLALGAPKLVLLLWLATIAAALPAALLVGDALADSFATSLVAERMRQGFDMDWYGEFENRARGIEATFTPTLAGAGVVYDNLEGWWSGRMFAGRGEVRPPAAGQSGTGQPEGEFPGLLGLGVAFALLWAFLLGGVLERQARPGEPFTFERFAAGGGRYFFRFLRLALLSAGLYFLVYLLGRRLYRAVQEATLDVTEERTILLWILLAAGLVAFLLHLVRMVFDYAKIAAVLEGRRNVFEIAWEGLRFVLQRPLATLGVTFGFGVLGVLLFVLYLWLAPGAGQSTVAGVVLAFLFSQFYLAARLTVRLGLLAGQMSLYRAGQMSRYQPAP